MQIEQTLEMYSPLASRKRQTNYFVVGDLEYLSASALYIGSGPIKPLGSGPLRIGGSGPLSGPTIKISPVRIVIPFGNLGLGDEEVIDIHETYDIDRFDNLFKGHLSITGKKKKKKRFGHEEPF